MRRRDMIKGGLAGMFGLGAVTKEAEAKKPEEWLKGRSSVEDMIGDIQMYMTAVLSYRATRAVRSGIPISDKLVKMWLEYVFPALDQHLDDPILTNIKLRPSTSYTYHKDRRRILANEMSGTIEFTGNLAMGGKLVSTRAPFKVSFASSGKYGDTYWLPSSKFYGEEK
jgi:hypothetical protein